jgi:sulfur carrier protein ThiS
MMSTQTQTQTISVLAIVPGQSTEDVQVAPGTTVAQLAEQLGIENAGRISALDGQSEAIGPDSEITEQTEVVNFVYKLAGA